LTAVLQETAVPRTDPERPASSEKKRNSVKVPKRGSEIVAEADSASVGTSPSSIPVLQQHSSPSLIPTISSPALEPKNRGIKNILHTVVKKQTSTLFRFRSSHTLPIPFSPVLTDHQPISVPSNPNMKRDIEAAAATTAPSISDITKNLMPGESYDNRSQFTARFFSFPCSSSIALLITVSSSL